MAQAYRQSAILMTACELKVFTYLSQGPMSAEALAHHCQVPVRGLQRLLNACVVLDLLEKEDESYHNTPIAETFLVQGKSGYMGNFIQAGAEQYEAWGHLIQAIQEDRPIRPHSAEALPTLPADRIRGYVARLYELGKHNAVAIADRVDLGACPADARCCRGIGNLLDHFCPAPAQPPGHGVRFAPHYPICPGNHCRPRHAGTCDSAPRQLFPGRICRWERSCPPVQ